ncbi:MAG: leucyl aminopeptidase [Bacillota bacterium]|nr:leucyl aminopeptidase [Bacillota bacterium]
MIGVNNNKLYSNLLIFKFENHSLYYPKDLENILTHSENSGKLKEIEDITTLGQCIYKKIFVIGLGTIENFNSIVLLNSIGTAIRKIKDSIEELDILDNFEEDYGFTLGEAVSISLYHFKGLKKVAEEQKLKNINIISPHANSIYDGLNLGSSTNFVRELVNLPSNIVTPKYLCQKAEDIAKDGNLKIEIKDKFTLEQMGMNGILSVAKGSVKSPRLIVVQYWGNDKDKNITAIIGKGVTFDSGGISIKPSKGMEDMIEDMAGAASILGTMKYISYIKPRKNILALIPVVENMPSANAYKPGDVITTYSKKTVQVISTDAEGRLILCDAITYAKELGATTIIDVATLTGSCANFLGDINIGMLCNNDILSNNIINAGRDIGENIWRMPNNPDYLEQLKTPSADLKNTGTNCGAIVAGLFLESFAEGTDFAHLDIAGCSSFSKASNIYSKGASGMPTRTLINYLMKF